MSAAGGRGKRRFHVCGIPFCTSRWFSAPLCQARLKVGKAYRAVSEALYLDLEQTEHGFRMGLTRPLGLNGGVRENLAVTQLVGLLARIRRLFNSAALRYTVEAGRPGHDKAEKCG